MDLTQWLFMISDGLVALLCCFGNLLIIVAFCRERGLRTITNAYVLSLAFADLLVGGVGIPLTLYTMVTQKPGNLYACLLFNTWIMMLCTVSILHLLAVSYDRFFIVVASQCVYSAVLRFLVIVIHLAPVARRLKKRRAVVLLTGAWVLGAAIGFLPIMGWSKDPPQPRCVFMEVMDLSYLVTLFGATIVFPTLLMAFFYLRIYIRVHQHQKQTANLRRTTMNPSMAQDRQDSKRKKILISLFIVIVSFLVGWYPLYVLNTVTYFCPSCDIPSWVFFVSIVLTHLTSAVNPLIYAYTMPGFAPAFRRVLHLPGPVVAKASTTVMLERPTAVTLNGNGVLKRSGSGAEYSRIAEESPLLSIPTLGESPTRPEELSPLVAHDVSTAPLLPADDEPDDSPDEFELRTAREEFDPDSDVML